MAVKLAMWLRSAIELESGEMAASATDGAGHPGALATFNFSFAGAQACLASPRCVQGPR